MQLSNLRDETLRFMEEIGKCPFDVMAVERDGFSMPWSLFMTVSNFIYNKGLGTEHVRLNLRIHFRDGTWLEREVYDGAEDWAHKRPLEDYSKLLKTEDLTEAMQIVWEFYALDSFQNIKITWDDDMEYITDIKVEGEPVYNRRRL